MISGTNRFTFGMNELNDGVALAPFIVGLFGISEILITVDAGLKREVIKTSLKDILPNRQDWHKSIWPITRGTLLGFFLGLLPGGGTIISSFASYVVEKRISKHPELFGTGEIAGVAGPESANNSAAQSSFVPLLSLGIPPNAVIAMVFAALLIHGIQPGPLMISEHPDVFWGLIASMLIGNAMLLVLNLPMIGIWVQALRIPLKTLMPLIVVFCFIGAYSVNSSMLDLKIMLGFGIGGYIMRKLNYELAPMCLAFILGPILENNLRQSLIISHGSFEVFIVRPISVTCLGITLLLFVSNFVPFIKRRLKKLEDLEIT